MLARGFAGANGCARSLGLLSWNVRSATCLPAQMELVTGRGRFGSSVVCLAGICRVALCQEFSGHGKLSCICPYMSGNWPKDWLHPVLTPADVQMGGAEGVDKGEINRLTLQPGNGMWMSCKPWVTKRMLATMPEE